MSTQYKYLLIEKPKEGISRVLLNRPEKRNAMFNPLRKELFSALEDLDRDEETRVIILGGAGKCFSAGYDLGFNVSSELPYHTSTNEGFWPRHVVEGAFKIWDLSTPVVAQVHGYCLAGGTELATSCDLVYVENSCLSFPHLHFHSRITTPFYTQMSEKSIFHLEIQ